MTEIRAECTECLAHDVFEADIQEAEAEYRAGVMCDNIMCECGHDVTDMVVVIDGVERQAAMLPYFQETNFGESNEEGEGV